MQEIYGRADGFQIDRKQFLASICFSGVTRNEACTDIVVKVNENEVISRHNEDLLETLEEAALIKYRRLICFIFTFLLIIALKVQLLDGIVMELLLVLISTWFILRDIVFAKNIKNNT